MGICRVALVWLALAVTVAADDGKPSLLAKNAADVAAALAALGQPLPAETVKALRAEDDAIHDALGGHTLLVVSINPEGRVKLARGPADAELIRGDKRFVLVKVINQSGARQQLTVRGSYAGAAESPFAVTFVTHGAVTPDLTGLPTEYRILSVTASAAGKRELSVTVEAGQGTQELGFRGEAPILFSVREAGKK